MRDIRAFVEKHSPGQLFLSSLAVSYFATFPLGVLVGLLLIDIASTFHVSVGAMGQISTISNVVAVIFGLFMSILSVRFKHKSLLIVGLLCVSISAFGCFLAPTLSLMQALYSLSGVGTAMVFPMTLTLIGEHFPLEKRANAVGWIMAAASLSYIVGAPVIGFIADIGGWRLVLLGFVIPVSVASLILAFLSLPSTSRRQQPAITKETYLRSFKQVLISMSATACLVGNILRTAAFMAILLYGISFFRQRFLVSTNLGIGIMLGAALCYTLGSLVAGRLANSFGRNPLTVLSSFLAGIFIISFVYLHNLWFSLAVNFLGSWFSGMASSTANSLSLEQVPEFRGTMMSINSAAISLGGALGAAVGGSALDLFNYDALGLILGVMGLAAAVVFYFLTIDPSRT